LIYFIGKTNVHIPITNPNNICCAATKRLSSVKRKIPINGLFNTSIKITIEKINNLVDFLKNYVV